MNPFVQSIGSIHTHNYSIGTIKSLNYAFYGYESNAKH